MVVAVSARLRDDIDGFEACPSPAADDAFLPDFSTLSASSSRCAALDELLAPTASRNRL
jgi:hypothetical protein